MAINTKNIKLTHSTLDNIKTKESPAEKTAFVIRLSAIGSNKYLYDWIYYYKY